MSGKSGYCVEILPQNEVITIKERIEKIINEPSSNSIDVLEGYLYLRVLIEYFIDNCLLNKVRSRLNPEDDKILWNDLAFLKILEDTDGKKGSDSIVREKYSKISALSIHIDKRKQVLPYGKPQLIEDLSDLKNKNSVFRSWYENL
jgi:hypothetical protein